jgi:sugar phosphate isomerase/epimerase
MVAYGFNPRVLGVDLDLARRMGASVVEVLPDWENLPDPAVCRRAVSDAGLTLRSAHGSWGSRSITGTRVDLASIDEHARVGSVDDIKRCSDWLTAAGGSHLVVHPGGLSDLADHAGRSEALLRSLSELVEHVAASGVTLCVENMPPGVHPGSRMADLARIVEQIDHPRLRLIVDTGHARLCASPESETLAAGTYLASVHVHDNDGRADLHLPPGAGVIDWPGWVRALDTIGYDGPILLECIRQIRHDPQILSRPFLTLLADLTRDPRVMALRDAAPA